MNHFPECPKCEQRALYPKEVERPPVHACPDCECASDEEPETLIRCAACGHVVAEPSAALRMEAENALLATCSWAEDVENYWKKKLADERAKVARLAEGRW